MKKILIASFILLFTGLCSFAQFNESFTDGDFSNNPAWVGGTTDWTVNPSFQLQSNNLTVNSTYYLSTASTLATSAEWNFFCELAFNPSSANYVDVFLTASTSDITAAATTGYFVRLGGTDDEICLFRKDNGAAVKIIDGVNAVLNSSSNAVQIKVIRDASNQWQLIRNHNASGNFTEGNVTDANYLSSGFFGILVKQSTASFFQKHFIDDISLQNFVPDVLPPSIVTLTATSANSLDVLFNEPVEQASSEIISNYVVSGGIGSPVTAVRDVSNSSLVHLSFSANFPLNTNLQLTANGIDDLSGNTLVNGTGSFSYNLPQQYSVVIDELMADPDPQVSLPNLEWLELRNTTGFNIDLQNWRLIKSTGPSGPMPAYTLRPDSFVIVCTGSAVAALSVYGPVISVSSFPSLSNTGDLISLQSPQGLIIHSVNYSSSWYQNDLKEDGGWSLEMVDTKNPCSGSSNWKASTDASGGTPGRKNSVDAVNPDVQSPELLRAYTTDNLNITLVFNEPLDSVSAALASKYSVSDGIGTPVSAVPVGPLFDRVRLILGTPLQAGTIYTITVTNTLTDCGANGIGSVNTARVGLPAVTVDSFDIVINEILFNPSSNSNDYVEIYNRSNKVLNLKNISIANASDFERVSEEDYLFFPGDFMVLTESKAMVLNVYVANNLLAFIELDMPSFNDDAGDVRIINEQGNIVDRVQYLDDWQFQLITNEEGVALERIDYDAPSQNQANWHSAATNVNYGTPTYKNSQFRLDAGVQGEISIDPEIFSPDNDGRDDVATINYNFPEPGYVANITVFDAVGRRVKFLQRNALTGIKGYFRWDGLDEKNQKLPVGIYIIYTEIFNLQGKTKKFKNTIVLARKQ